MLMLSRHPATAPVTGGDELDLVRRSLTLVQRWVEAADYKGYEPFDALSSPWRRLTGGNLLAERIFQQVVRQSPVNLRALIGIKPLDSTKGRGMMAWGYLLLFKSTGEAEFRDRAVACLEWLDRHKSPKFEKHSWANYFDFASRGGAYRRHDSIIVWTSLIGQAYLEAFEQLQDERFLRIAQSACAWILSLPRERTARGNCLSYYAHSQESIHNANMLGAAVLARAFHHVGSPQYVDVARSAMVYSCSRMREDGSWWYGEQPNCRWIDNFHTGYNLDALKCYIHYVGDTEFADHLRRGFAFFKGHFFEPSGCPKYYHQRRYPVDIQCASQAIDTLAYFGEDDVEALPLALKVARWTIANMQDRRGFFYYRKYALGITARTPMLHWGQATMFKALAHLVTQPSSQRVANARTLSYGS
jgi:rhamnogalacturonyl hydrolase YesR